MGVHSCVKTSFILFSILTNSGWTVKLCCFLGCTDINECSIGHYTALTRGTHTCKRTRDLGEICYNNDGGYICGSCDMGTAEKMEGQEGSIKSHKGISWGKKYGANITKEWYIKVELGYHVELTIQNFAVRKQIN